MTNPNEIDHKPSSSVPFYSVLAFILFLNLFMIHTDGSVRDSLETIGFFLFLLAVFSHRMNLKKQLPLIIGSSIALLLNMFVHTTRSYLLVTNLVGAFTLVILLALVYLLSMEIPFFHSLAECIFMPLRVAKNYVFCGFGNFFKLFEKSSAPSEAKTAKFILIRKLVIGAVIGVPLILILVSMLSSADAIYANFVEHLFDNGWLTSLPDRLFYSGVIFLLLIPFLNFRKEKEFRSPFSGLLKLHVVHEMTIAMALVAIVLGSFLVIQWPYIFAHVAFETDLSKYGVATYSEYVRKGFGELLKVSIFVYALVWAGLFALRGKKDNEKSLLTGVQMIVIAELIVFVISIFRRIWLYQQYHGWTLVRIYGGFFLAWLLGIVIFLALRHVAKKNWFIAEAVFTTLFVIVIGFFNAEQFIVLNHPPTVNKRVDYVYLSRMSADGIDGWKAAYEQAQTTIARVNSKTGIITKDERRDVAYAGRITTNLLETYENLVLRHGTKEEIQAYHKIAFDTYFTYLKPEFEYYKRTNQTDSSYYQDMQSDLTEMKKVKLVTDKSEVVVQVKDVDSLYQFDSDYKPNPYLRFSEEHDSGRPSLSAGSYDRFLKWNDSEVQAYEYMKTNMSQEQLLRLLDQYMDVYTKIHKQPEKERGYDMDISQDTPLL